MLSPEIMHEALFSNLSRFINDCPHYQRTFEVSEIVRITQTRVSAIFQPHSPPGIQLTVIIIRLPRYAAEQQGVHLIFTSPPTSKLIIHIHNTPQLNSHEIKKHNLLALLNLHEHTDLIIFIVVVDVGNEKVFV